VESTATNDRYRHAGHVPHQTSFRFLLFAAAAVALCSLHCHHSSTTRTLWLLLDSSNTTMSPSDNSKRRTLVVTAGAVAVAILAIALHGIDNTSSLNLIFPVVLDGIQYLFGSSRKDETMFEYAEDGLPLCMKCHCTPSWDQDPATFTCPTEAPPPWQYSAETIETLASQQVLNPYSLECDPYQNKTCDTVPSLEKNKWSNTAVCGLLFQEPPVDAVQSWRRRQQGSTCPLTNYTTQTFASEQEATNNRAVITHTGPCGACSTTQDLAAYMSHPDMVHAGRRCTNRVLMFGHASGVACYEALGFTQPCATIWAQNSLNTATVCRKKCVRHLFSPPNLPEPHCKLNECLHCDEVKSGPNFALFAGRTRRNSGLRTPILRQCDGLANIEHVACPVDTVVAAAMVESI